MAPASVSTPTAVAAVLAVALSAGLCTVSSAAERRGAFDPIQPYAENPRYWQYKGRPVALLGGSKDDNLFQIPDLDEHLKLLAAVGGNYVRNTMSARDAGNVQPFARLPDGRYDLERWNEEYWRRFEKLLQRTYDLDIIVQIEVWDRFDYSRKEWESSPFNPKNNVNYTPEQSGLAAEYPDHPGQNKQPFFFTTPTQRNNTAVLRFQQRFVDEMLRRSLRFPNVLYCIDNETSADEAWGAYWADYIRSRARAAGRPAVVTEMWDEWDLQASQHRRSFDRPERYDFVEVSQGNHQRGENHWNKLQWARRYVESRPRPLNAVKTYGADSGRKRTTQKSVRWRGSSGSAAATDTYDDYGDTQEGAARWWRQLIGGAAAVRFHRPPSGLGLNEQAQQHLRSARMFLKEFDIVRAAPDVEHERLSRRHTNEAYLTHVGEEAFAAYFPDGGDVRLAISPTKNYRLRWLDIAAGRWLGAADVPAASTVRLRAPASGHWLALVEKK